MKFSTSYLTSLRDFSTFLSAIRFYPIFPANAINFPFILVNSPQLVKEAIEELKIGINSWSELEPDTFNFEEFFLRFKENIKRHIGEIPDELFGDIEDDYYTTKNLNWMKKFNPKFLKDYNNANTTSN